MASYFSYASNMDEAQMRRRCPGAVRGPRAVLRDYKLSAFEMIARFPVAGLRIAWHSLLARLRGDVSVRSDTPMRSPWRVVRRLYLDRYFAVALGLPLAVALLAGLVPRWVGWPVGLMAVTLAIPPVRRKQFAHRDVRVTHRGRNEYFNELAFEFTGRVAEQSSRLRVGLG